MMIRIQMLSTTNRRRRSLLLILRTIAEEEEVNNDTNKSSSKSIRKIEKIALKEAKKSVTPQDILQRIPDGLETPTYKLLKTNYKSKSLSTRFYEIREYDPFSTCSVIMSQPTSSSGGSSPGSGFNSLAGYLFGKNQSSEKMKMTTPVFSSSTDTSSLDGAVKQMSFVLPSEYWNQIENAPKPIESNAKNTDDTSSTTSDVSINQQEKQVRAVFLFGGFAPQKEVDVLKKELIHMVDQDKDWMLADEESKSTSREFVLAQYNDPFTPPWKRRNEVSVLVVPRT